MKRFVNLFLFVILITGITVAFNSCSEDEATFDESELIVSETEEDIAAEKDFLLKCYHKYRRPKTEEYCGNSASYYLYASKHYKVGKVTIANDEENLYVRYSVWGWYLGLTETHLYIGDIDGMPINRGGNPQIGQFDYSDDHGWVKTYTYTIPLSELPDCFVVAAHAVVNGRYTAWAKADCSFKETFGGHRWGWYICEFCIGECEKDIEKLMVLKARWTVGRIKYNAYNVGTPVSETCPVFNSAIINVTDLDEELVELIDADGNSLGDAVLTKMDDNTIQVVVVPDADFTTMEVVKIFFGTQEELDVILDAAVEDGKDCPEYQIFPYGGELTNEVIIPLD